jgi:hypothetical protein
VSKAGLLDNPNPNFIGLGMNAYPPAAKSEKFFKKKLFLPSVMQPNMRGGGVGGVGNNGNNKKPASQGTSTMRRKFTLPALSVNSSNIILNNQYSSELKKNHTTRRERLTKNASLPSADMDDPALVNNDLIFDPIDPNLVYSVSSLTRHYVFREPVSVQDPYEGFLDLSCIKHIRHGCLDAQVLTQLQHIAASKFGMAQFDQSNVICLVYGTTLAENRSLYMLGMRQSVKVFYTGVEFLVGSLKRERELCTDMRLKWLKDLYLNLFYDNGNKRFQCPTTMQALLAFGGRQFNLQTLENSVNAAVNNLLTILTTPSYYNSQHVGGGASGSHPGRQHHLPISPHQHQQQLILHPSGHNINNNNELLLMHHTDQSIDLDSTGGPVIVIQPKHSLATNSSSSSSLKKRKSSASIRSLKLTQRITARFNSNSNDPKAVAQIKKKPMAVIYRFQKLTTINKQKSLIHDLFLPRSSSASFDRQNSMDSTFNQEIVSKFQTKGNKKKHSKELTAANQKKKMSSPSGLAEPGATAASQSPAPTINGPVLPFRAPFILSLAKINPAESGVPNTWSTKILVSSLIKNSRHNATSLSSSSGVSTLKSGRNSNCWSNHSNRSKASTSSLGIGSTTHNQSPSVSSSSTNLATAAATAVTVNTAPPLVEFHVDSNSSSDQMKLGNLLYGSYIEFPEFVSLFKAFYVNMRKDLKELYDRYAVLVSSGRDGLNDPDVERTWQSVRKYWKKLIYENNLQNQSSSSNTNTTSVVKS